MFFASPPQLEFLQCTAKRILLRAGNKVGKTEVGGYRASEHLRGTSFYRPMPTRKTKGIIVGLDWQTVREDVSPAIMRYLPDYMWAKGTNFNASRGESGWKNNRIELKNGNSALLMSAAKPSRYLAGYGADWVWVNEPLAPGLYNEVVRAVFATGGEFYLTATMVGQDLTWLQDLVEGDAARGIAPQPGWAQVQIPLDAHSCPFRTEEDIELQKSSVLKAEYAQRVEGAWKGVAVDRFIDGFDNDNVSAAIPPKDWHVVIYIDWGSGPRLYIGLGIYDAVEAWAIDEWVPEGGTAVAEVAAQIRLMVARSEIDLREVDQLIGDTNTAELGYADKMNELLTAELGRKVDDARKGKGSVLYGVRVLNSAAKSKKFKVHPRCVHLERALRYWKGSDKGKDGQYKHSLDATRYGLLEALEALHSQRQLQHLRIM